MEERRQPLFGRLALLFAATALLASCTSEIEGPAPVILPGSVERVSPPVVRGESDVIGLCGDTIMVVDGMNFSPLLTELANNEVPEVLMPTVQLEYGNGGVTRILGLGGNNVAWLDEGHLEVRLPFCVDEDVSPLECTDPLLPFDLETGGDEFPFGFWTVRVVNPNGLSDEMEAAIQIVPPPFLESVDTGRGAVGTLVCSQEAPSLTLRGASLRDLTEVIIGNGQGGVRFSGVAGEAGSGVIFINENEVEVTLPASLNLETGIYSVEIINPEECLTLLDQGLEVISPPLERIDPSIVCNQADTTIQLLGSDLDEGASVSIGGDTLPASAVTFVDSSTYNVELAAGTLARGTYNLMLSYFEGCETTLVNELSVVTAPVITSVEPSVVPAGISATITITGQGFEPETRISVGDLSGLQPDEVTLDGTSMTITVPGDILDAGESLDVTVINPADCGQDTLTNGLTVAD